MEARLRGQRAQTHSGRSRCAAGEPVRPHGTQRCSRRRGRSQSTERERGILYRRLESLKETRGRFVLNTRLPIAFDARSQMEVDLLSADSRVVIEIDGAQHLSDAVAYRRDRRKDLLLQENGYRVLRFLAEDVGKELDSVLDTILRTLVQSQRRLS